MIDILGTEYKVHYRKYDEDTIFAEQEVDGYCDGVEKEIVICILSTHPKWKGVSIERCAKSELETFRHEAIHALLNESGLSHSSLVFNDGWASNEEMIDFFALQFPKLKLIMDDVEKIHKRLIFKNLGVR